MKQFYFSKNETTVFPF